MNEFAFLDAALLSFEIQHEEDFYPDALRFTWNTHERDGPAIVSTPQEAVVIGRLWNPEGLTDQRSLAFVSAPGYIRGTLMYEIGVTELVVPPVGAFVDSPGLEVQVVGISYPDDLTRKPTLTLQTRK